MDEIDKAEFNANAAKLRPQQVRAFAMTYMLGVAVGELLGLGFTEAEVREGFEAAIQQDRALRDKGPTA